MENYWKPPKNYQETKSLDPAIRVWKPIKQTDLRSPEQKTYNCPQCGAPTQFDLHASGIQCKHCGYLETPGVNQVGKSAQELEFRTETLEKSITTTSTHEQTYCENCGAELLVGKTELSMTCPFCASNKVVLKKAVSNIFLPSAILPFKIEKEEVKLKITEWLGKGWFHPNALNQKAKINQLTAVYTPAWTFDTHIQANWKALVGYERQQRYYDSSSKSWKTKTVIDWRWENGKITRTIDDYFITGTDKIKKNLFEKIQNFNLNELMEFSSDFLAGWKALLHTKQLPQAWDEAKNDIREIVKKDCYQDIPTHHVRNFSMEADFQDETWRLIFIPIYIISYKYNEETFQVITNGQNNALAGQKPVDWNKIWLAFIGLFSPGVLIALISLILLVAGLPGIIGLVVSIILIIIAGIFAAIIYSKAKSSEKGT